MRTTPLTLLATLLVGALSVTSKPLPRPASSSSSSIPDLESYMLSRRAALSKRSGIPESPYAHLTAQERAAKLQAWNAGLARRAAEEASKYPVEHIGNVSDYSLWQQYHEGGNLAYSGQGPYPENVQPIRGKTGSNVTRPAAENVPIDVQNPDIFAPPSTDSGTVPNAKWPFALSHNRLSNGGWARQQNVDVLPVATEMAAVNMRLEKGAIREMHWHTAGEWAYILSGKFRIGVVDQDGSSYVSDLDVGDVWFFPSGIPHYIQALSDDGGDFLLVFTDGKFSEDDTLLLSDFVSHIPREVLVKNFPGLSNSAFNTFPKQELYIFPAPAPNTTQEDSVSDNPQGKSKRAFSYPFSKVEPQQLNGGTVKILDSRNFSTTELAVAEVTIEPGAMRELHWHPNSDEWSFFLKGNARVTIFANNNNARTYDFNPNDVMYVQKSNGHMVEALGNETVHYLEIFKAPQYADVSLSNWIANTPAAVVKAHLGLNDNDIAALKPFKTHNNQLVKPNPSDLPPLDPQLQRNGQGQGKQTVVQKRSIAQGRKSWY